jgi:hypothetical protein
MSLTDLLIPGVSSLIELSDRLLNSLCTCSNLTSVKVESSLLFGFNAFADNITLDFYFIVSYSSSFLYLALKAQQLTAKATTTTSKQQTTMKSV